MFYFLEGILVGILISIPVGPVGVLCIRRTLVQGTLFGFISGLGAATADALYGGIAAFGLTFVFDFLLQNQLFFQLVGGLLLVFMGINAWIKPSREDMTVEKKASKAGAYWSVFFVTLANPITLLAFGGILAGLGIGSTVHDSYLLNVSLILGVFTGATIWWSTLSYGVGRLRERLPSMFFTWMNRIVGTVLILFGIGMLSYSMI
ncbi:LysE family translocator [Priestia taiwanensis]|nr:LysE family transporter [Priestia taiwanensis]